jgi:SAM-dependent methyltransferase
VALSEGEDWPVGIDLSPQMGRLARGRLKERGLPARLTRGRGQALPFAAASFDGVVAAFPAPYILEAETVSGLWRVLRPGGRLVIVPEAELTGGGPLAWGIEWLNALTGQRGDEALSDEERAAIWSHRLGVAGFGVAVHRVQGRESLVTVIVAERQAAV